MYKAKIIAVLVATALGIHYSYAEESTVLDEIEVSTEAYKAKDEAFIKAGAVSVRDNIQHSTQSIDNIIRSVPGAFTQADKSQGVVSPNIRGMTGFGRVNTMIDGVSQTFYATSTDDGGRGSGTSQFGALIDPNFLVAVDIERGSFSGKAGANSLMGAVNFRTFGVNDLVEKGRNLGFSLKALGGTNALGPNYMGAIGLKKEFENQRWLGLVYGYSWRKISQDYKVGGGGRVTDRLFELSDPVCTGSPDDAWDCVDQDDLNTTATAPFNPEHLRQNPRSQLLKLEYGDLYQQLTLGYRSYDNFIAGRQVDNKNYQVDYHFQLPDSPWVNFNLLYSTNYSDQKYAKGQSFMGREMTADLIAYNKSTTLDISNSFEKEWASGLYTKTTIGVNLLRNKYDKNRHPSELNVNFNEDDECVGLAIYRCSYTNSSFQPNGKQKLNTFYIDNTFDYKMFSLNLNANVVKHRIKGEYAENLDDYISYTQSRIYQLEQNRQFAEASALEKHLKSIGDKYCHYNDGWEDGEYYPEDKGYYGCDKLGENIFWEHQAKHRKVNYSALLSLNINELFSPFIGYAKTHRMPNIKEMYLSNFGKAGTNFELKPEQANTYQIGVNGFKEGVFTDTDKLGYKITAYKTNIKNYIYNIKYNSPSFVPGYEYYPSILQGVLKHINSDDKVTNKGVELEFNYDMGRVYSNLSLAYQKSNAKASFTDRNPRVDVDPTFYRNELTYGASKVAFLPKLYGSLELGTRWFDNKFTVGGIAKYFGKSKRASIKTGLVCDRFCDIPHKRRDVGEYRKVEEVEKQPMVFDFYLSYEPIKDMVFKAEVQNAFNKKYIDPLDSNNDSATQTIYLIEKGDIDIMANFARGRTYVFSLSYKF